MENRAEFEEMMGSTVKEPKKQGRPKQVHVKFTYQELMLKHERFFKLITYFLKSDVELTADEFVEESKDLSRIAQDFEIVGKIISWLDPLFYLGGILGKVLDVAKGRKNAPKEASNDTTTEGNPVPDGGGNLLNLARRTAHFGNTSGQGDNSQQPGI